MNQIWQMWPSILDDTTIDKIVAEAYTYQEQDGNVGDTAPVNDTNYRRSKIRWIDVYNPTSFFLKDLAWHFASIANRNAFGFDIDIVHEMQYTEYSSDNNGTYGWHHDVFWGSNRPYDRKLSVIFQLTDESDYQGGDFQIESQYEQPWANSVKKKGTVIVFPSFIPHQVTPVTSGLRRSLVTWIEGPKFK